MIRSVKNIFSLLPVLLILVSCSDETLIGPKERVVEDGIPVTINIPIGKSDIEKIETRSSDISENDPVNSLAILIFKKKNNAFEKVGNTHFFTKENLSNNSVSLNTTSGKRYVYAVANYQSSIFEDLEERLSGISSLDDLKQLSVELKEKNTSVLDGRFLMSGFFIGEDTREEGLCFIEPGMGSGAGHIDLKRIMSSIQFKVICGKENATFTVDSWQVKNIPQKSLVVEQENDLQGNKYVDTEVSSVFTTTDQEANFSFLMMENRKISGNEIIGRDEREKMAGTPEGFVNAPENSTYVILKGTFTGTTDETIDGDHSSGKAVKAYTTYYIHLGDWRKKNGQDWDYKNYSISRNNRYLYTVNVMGVDKLIVEVETDNDSDESWGGDGDMFVSTNNIRTFDAHYETTVISFSKKMIGLLRKKYGNAGGDCTVEQFKDKFLIYASTPKNDFGSDSSDVDWVTYKKNTGGSNEFMKYQGDKDVELLSADQFKESLYNAYNELAKEDDEVYYTCFIDEYFYGDKNGNYDGSLTLDKFVNQRPRTIQICTYYNENSETSSNSSINMAAYTFSQRSICTVYDLGKVKKGINGWGTEWTQEGDNLGIGEDRLLDGDLLQGRNNMWKQLENSYFAQYEWVNYIDHTNNHLNDDENMHVYSAEYACLTRNRDLNGNGEIDANELRWYLPAINQYMAFFMGADVLPEEVRLFNKKEFDLKAIYISSTWMPVPGTSPWPGVPDMPDLRVFWACEGSSTGFFGAAEGRGSGKPYRCVRNLRSVQEEVVDIVNVSDASLLEDGAYRYLYFENLNPAAKRTNVSHELTYGHTNFDEENRLPNGIEVGEVVKNTGKKLTAQLATSINPCAEKGEGWRLPNQRELTLLTSHQKDDQMEKVSLFSCTKSKYPPKGFSGDDQNINNSNRIYFGYENKNMTMWMNNVTDVSYRCVKDINNK